MTTSLRRKNTSKADGELLGLFHLAETLGKTVDELLLGKPSPISNAELRYWQAYWTVKAEIQAEAEKKASKGSSNKRLQDNPEFKKTMGNRPA